MYAPTQQRYPTNAKCARENEKKLRDLPGTPHVFQAKDEGAWNAKASSCAAPTTLRLKKRAQVILLKNLDFDRGLVNGSRGVVVGFSKLPCVRDEEEEEDEEEDEDEEKETEYPLVLFEGLCMHGVVFSNGSAP